MKRIMVSTIRCTAAHPRYTVSATIGDMEPLVKAFSGEDVWFGRGTRFDGAVQIAVSISTIADVPVVVRAFTVHAKTSVGAHTHVDGEFVVSYSIDVVLDLGPVQLQPSSQPPSFGSSRRLDQPKLPCEKDKLPKPVPEDIAGVFWVAEETEALAHDAGRLTRPGIVLLPFAANGANLELREPAANRPAGATALKLSADFPPQDGSRTVFVTLDEGLTSVVFEYPDDGYALRLHATTPRAANVVCRSAPPACIHYPPGPVYDSCLPGEMWMTVNHLQGGTLVARDVALFSIAPLIFTSVLEKPLAVWVTSVVDTGQAGDEDEPTTVTPGNYGFVFQLRQITKELGIDLVEIPGQDCANDVFIRDAVIFGYCWAPWHLRTVVLQCPRSNMSFLQVRPGVERMIDVFAHDAPPYAGIELYADVFGGEPNQKDSREFGGNVIVTPCLNPRGKAPLGKLIVGSSTKLSRGLMEVAFQPLVQIDTSWLEVRHVDEIMNFVPCPAPCGFALVCADPDRALILCEGAEKLGVVRRHRVQGSSLTRISLADAQPALNQATPIAKIQLAVKTVTKELGVDAPVVGLPVLFAPGYKSFLPNAMNFLCLGKVVIVPKPWGPRVSIASAKLLFGGAITPHLEGLCTEHHFLHHLQLGQEKPLGGNCTQIDTMRAPDVEGAPVPTAHDNKWFRLTLKQDSVDVFEAEIVIVLSRLELDVRFVDDWEWYHRVGGEIHCGTNVMRQPHRLAWWNTDIRQ